METPTPLPLPFDLRGLEVFLAVCDSGTMSAAARALGLTQPAVSQTIADMESKSGLTLLDRRTRPLGPTAAGLVLFERARALLDDARQIAPLMRQTRDGRVATLRIGLVDSLSRAVTGALAAEIGQLADHATFRAGLTDDHASALLTRRLDVFLGADEQADLAAVVRLPICREPYVFICPKHTGPVTLAEISARLPMLRYASRSRTGIEIERHLRRLRLEPARTLEFETPLGLTDSVARGLGFAITTPLCLYESGVPLAAVDIHRLTTPTLTRTLTLIARARELGRAPDRLAAIARLALQTQVVPALATHSTWLGSALKF